MSGGGLVERSALAEGGAHRKGWTRKAIFMSSAGGGVRLDKWLWAARFFKTRQLAIDAIDGGKVHLNGNRVKPAKGVRPGDELSVRKGPYEFVVIVRDLSERRGPASEAAKLYEETPESLTERERLRAQLSVALPTGPESKPDKKNRRQIAAFKRSKQE